MAEPTALNRSLFARIFACFDKGNLSALKELYELHGRENLLFINQTNKTLHYACNYINQVFSNPVKGDLLQGRQNIIEFLCEENNSSEIEALDSGGNTPLHRAVMGYNLELVSYLIRSGVNPNMKNKNGQTPLHLAALKNNAPSRIILGFLLEHHAVNPLAMDGFGTILHVAVRDQNLDVIKEILSPNHERLGDRAEDFGGVNRLARPDLCFLRNLLLATNSAGQAVGEMHKTGALAKMIINANFLAAKYDYVLLNLLDAPQEPTVQIVIPVQADALAVQDAPVQAGAVQDAPVQAGAVQDAPAQAGAVQVAPAQAGAVQDAPALADILVQVDAAAVQQTNGASDATVQQEAAIEKMDEAIYDSSGKAGSVVKAEADEELDVDKVDPDDSARDGAVVEEVVRPMKKPKLAE